METNNDNGSVYSEKVRAGKRTYFFDIKPTSKRDHYMVITESKKVSEDGGGYRRSKIFLYKEYLQDFYEAFQKVADKLE